MTWVSPSCGLVKETKLKIMLINFRDGGFKLFFKEMIEFQLQIDSRILNSMLSELEKVFDRSTKRERSWFCCPDFDDQDLSQSWKESLDADLADDQLCLEKLFKNPKFRHGYVEVDEKNAESVLRGLSEVRMILRENSLKEISDAQLESGEISFRKKNSTLRLGYFCYLILAEIQERIIAFVE